MINTVAWQCCVTTGISQPVLDAHSFCKFYSPVNAVILCALVKPHSLWDHSVVLCSTLLETSEAKKRLCCVLMHCYLPHNPYSLLLACFICVHASPGHLYILQLFTHCSYFVSSCLHPVFVCDVAIAFFIGVVKPYWTIVLHYLSPDVLYWTFYTHLVLFFMLSSLMLVFFFIWLLYLATDKLLAL